MPINLNEEFRNNGTRFRVYPQAPVLASIEQPELIWVSAQAGSVGAGPQDDRMYVRDAREKREPYEVPYLPPYTGALFPPPEPDAEGHFDHVPVATREFESAHMYAVIRRVLDVWETYMGRPIAWHFATMFERMELIPRLMWDNAQSGFGFIETGTRSNAHGDLQPFCLNFDVLAHEIGHSIIYAEVGWPTPQTAAPEYFGFQESAADMTALIASLHFDSVVDRLLQKTAGNLYMLNELNRIAELSEIEQIRVASNDFTMADYAAGWEKEHHLSQPLTGALFDVLVDVFHTLLIERHLIDDAMAEQIATSKGPDLDIETIQRRFDDAYAGQHSDFKLALLDARDHLGMCLASVWQQLSPDFLTYADVGHCLLRADLEFSDGRFQRQIFDAFRWRHIGTIAPGPRIGKPADDTTRSCR